MTDDGKPRGEVLSDSRATLRQVEGVLTDLGEPHRSPWPDMDRVISDLEERPTGLKDLVGILLQTYTEIMGVIDSLRESRGLLEQAAMERLQNTHAKLAEVTSTTETAATGMLDGLDRALVLVDHLESTAVAEEEEADSEALRAELRDELHQLIGLLQFQDITAQQLGYASGVLMDIEERMMRVAQVFDLRGLGIREFEEECNGGVCPVESASVTADPGASAQCADDRQALADEIFTPS